MNYRYLFASLLILLTLSGCTVGTDNPTIATYQFPSSDTAQTPSERVPRITVDELSQKINNGSDIIIVDTRLDVEQQYKVGHIKGAIAVPLSNITEGQWAPPADLGKEIIFYCSCPNDRTSARAALELIGKGYMNVKALKGGYNAWTEAGYPVESGAKQGG